MWRERLKESVAAADNAALSELSDNDIGQGPTIVIATENALQRLTQPQA